MNTSRVVRVKKGIIAVLFLLFILCIGLLVFVPGTLSYSLFRVQQFTQEIQYNLLTDPKSRVELSFNMLESRTTDLIDLSGTKYEVPAIERFIVAIQQTENAILGLETVERSPYQQKLIDKLNHARSILVRYRIPSKAHPEAAHNLDNQFELTLGNLRQANSQISLPIISSSDQLTQDSGLFAQTSKTSSFQEDFIPV